jgi:hypothetical protein
LVDVPGRTVDFSLPVAGVPVLTAGLATSLVVDRALILDIGSFLVVVRGWTFFPSVGVVDGFLAAMASGRASPRILLSLFLSIAGLVFLVKILSFLSVGILRFRASLRSKISSFRSVLLPSRAIRRTDSVSPEVRGFLSTKPPLRREKAR